METETHGPKQKAKLRSKEVPAAKVRRPAHTDLYKDGREYPDPTPVAPPVGFIKQPPLHDLIKQMVRSEALKRAAMQADAETFEEADDFDVGDDFDPTSPYEEVFDPPPVGPTVEQQHERLVDSLAQGLRKAFQEPEPAENPIPKQNVDRADRVEKNTKPPEKKAAAAEPPPNPLNTFFSRPGIKR